MKLRVRSLDSKESVRIEVPTPCSLHQFKEAISHILSSASSSSSSSIHLSLNRKDELHSSSAQDSLQSLGVTSGDLIFYTLNPNGFSRQTLETHSHTPHQHHQSTLSQSSQSIMGQEPQTLAPNSQKDETLDLNSQKDETLDLNSQKDETLEFCDTESMDVDDDESVVLGKSFSVPCFLRKVLRKEVNDDGGDHKLLVIAVHAVLLESGFVGFDCVSGMKVDGFHLPDEWPSSAFTMSLWYTLPELLGHKCYGLNAIETVVLKFQSLGKFVNIYGSLASNGSEPYRVCLDEHRLVAPLNFVWANCDSTDEMNGKDGSCNSSPEREVFEFWKIVKDGLALPLLIDLCEKAGLAPPPCLMRLPTELKLKILELLPGLDTAKVGCVCSELRYLSSNDDLWKQKFVEEFGNVAGSQGGSHWKERFALSLDSRKKRKRVSTMWRGFPRVDMPHHFPVRRDPNPLGFPAFIGGDYDRLPGLGIPSPFGQSAQRFPRFQMRRNFVHNCNLGGFNA